MKKPRQPHAVEPINGEPGRFRVESSSTPGEWYTVDIAEEHQDPGSGAKYYGTCPCKGWSVRKRCSHLDDARQCHADCTDTALVLLPSGRVYFASKVFLASMDQSGFDLWFTELCKRDEAASIAPTNYKGEPEPDGEDPFIEAESEKL